MSRTPLTTLAVVTFAAITLPPIAGAVVALVRDSWKPLGFGALCAAGLLVALVVGQGLADARKARRIALRAENGVHPDRGELEAEIDRLNGQVQLLSQDRWRCGPNSVDLERSRDGGTTWIRTRVMPWQLLDYASWDIELTRDVSVHVSLGEPPRPSRDRRQAGGPPRA